MSVECAIIQTYDTPAFILPEHGYDQPILMKTEKISELTTNRLSLYLRCLNELAAAGVETISSQSLAEQFNLNSAQIRRDLAYFGEFGVRGVGYYINDLRRHLREILGLDRLHRVLIIGAGNLGTALANYQGFNQDFNRDTFHIAALLDSDPEKIGKTTRSGIVIEDATRLAEVIAREKIDIAVIALPASAADQALVEVTAAGVKAVLNFAPAHLNPKPGVKLKNVDLAISLESLSYFLARPVAQALADEFRDFRRSDEPSGNGKSQPTPPT